MRTGILEGTERLRASVERGDFWRGGPASGPDRRFQEWSHFTVLGAEIDLLVNWSLLGGPSGTPVPRLAVLARTGDGEWEGDVEAFSADDTVVPPGSVGADFGRSSLRFRRGAYELDVRLPGRGIEANLRLRTRSRPALTSSVPLHPGRLQWFVVPRLEAEGSVRVGRRRFDVHGAPAYHDRDWGGFAWGGDFSWEWAVLLPRDRRSPWTAVLQRISDRRRHRTRSEGLLLWRDGRHRRTFLDGDLELEPHGFTPLGCSLRVPRVMRLAVPGLAADVPRRLDVRARRGSDEIAGELVVCDLAQVVVPNELDLGATLLVEARAEANLEGRVGGERFALAGPAILELNRAAA